MNSLGCNCSEWQAHDRQRRMLSKSPDTYKHLLEEMKMTKLNKTMAALLSASLLIAGLAGCQKRDAASSGACGSCGSSGRCCSGSSVSCGSSGATGSS